MTLIIYGGQCLLNQCLAVLSRLDEFRTPYLKVLGTPLLLLLLRFQQLLLEFQQPLLKTSTVVESYITGSYFHLVTGYDLLASFTALVIKTYALFLSHQKLTSNGNLQLILPHMINKTILDYSFSTETKDLNLRNLISQLISQYCLYISSSSFTSCIKAF